jgi:hypothetical protein
VTRRLFKTANTSMTAETTAGVIAFGKDSKCQVDHQHTVMCNIGNPLPKTERLSPHQPMLSTTPVSHGVLQAQESDEKQFSRDMPRHEQNFAHITRSMKLQSQPVYIVIPDEPASTSTGISDPGTPVPAMSQRRHPLPHRGQPQQVPQIELPLSQDSHIGTISSPEQYAYMQQRIFHAPYFMPVAYPHMTANNVVSYAPQYSSTYFTHYGNSSQERIVSQLYPTHNNQRLPARSTASVSASRIFVPSSACYQYRSRGYSPLVPSSDPENKLNLSRAPVAPVDSRPPAVSDSQTPTLLYSQTRMPTSHITYHKGPVLDRHQRRNSCSNIKRKDGDRATDDTKDTVRRLKKY